VTFKYTEQGPVGLLEGKKAVIVVASGGTKAMSEIDFATPWLKHFLGFIGITDVRVVTADQLGMDADGKMELAYNQIDALAA
jgi:FMN-dependent NADH-azoreductase